MPPPVPSRYSVADSDPPLAVLPSKSQRIARRSKQHESSKRGPLICLPSLTSNHLILLKSYHRQNVLRILETLELIKI